MSIQFLYCYNPNMPEQGEFIYHDKFPRFIAKIENGELTMHAKLDGEEADYEGKLSRAWKWYLSFKNGKQ